jgi:hypothetical protein
MGEKSLVSDGSTHIWSKPDAENHLNFSEKSFGCKHLVTSHGVTWNDICKSGVENPDSQIGLYAGDAESYDVFWEAFKPAIFKYHKLLCSDTLLCQPPMDFSCPPSVSLASNQVSQVYSTRVRISRNLKGFRFTSMMSLSERMQVYEIIKAALQDISGSFFDLEHLSVAQIQYLTDCHMMFCNQNRFMESANIFSHWPKGRAIFISQDRHTCVWINEEDHLRIMSIVPGFSWEEGINNIQQILKILAKKLDFSWSNKLGYLSSCPSNLGTGMRTSVMMKCTDAQVMRFQKLDLEIRGSQGEYTQVINNIYDISPYQRLGLTENQIMQKLNDALSAVILHHSEK